MFVTLEMKHEAARLCEEDVLYRQTPVVSSERLTCAGRSDIMDITEHPALKRWSLVGAGLTPADNKEYAGQRRGWCWVILCLRSRQSLYQRPGFPIRVKPCERAGASPALRGTSISKPDTKLFARAGGSLPFRSLLRAQQAAPLQSVLPPPLPF